MEKESKEESEFSLLLFVLPPLSWPVSFLTKQPGWPWSSESFTPHPTFPPAPEPSYSQSFLFVWLKTWPFFSHAAHREGRRIAQYRRTEGRLAGWRQRGETLNTPELGLIYFINRDYKFNLQTRGQNFSLTRGPWRTSGLRDHSYYWLHISICLWCSMSAFLPPLSPSSIFWQRGWF